MQSRPINLKNVSKSWTFSLVLVEVLVLNDIADALIGLIGVIFMHLGAANLGICIKGLANNLNDILYSCCMLNTAIVRP